MFVLRARIQFSVCLSFLTAPFLSSHATSHLLPGSIALMKGGKFITGVVCKTGIIKKVSLQIFVDNISSGKPVAGLNHV